MDSFAHYSQKVSVFVGQGFPVGLTFVEVESKHFGHIAKADHFFNLCSECEVAHLSVWRCFNFTDNDAVTCNVNLDFRIFFPRRSCSTDDSPSKGYSLSVWIISLPGITSSGLTAREQLRPIRSLTLRSSFKGKIISEIF